MDHNSCDQKSNCITNLKTSQQELESRIDFLLAKCRTEADIKKTADRGAMFSSGPFQISISLAVKMRTYQDDLLYCRRNPYDVLKSVCVDNGWNPPEFRAVDYMPGQGFLFSVIVNDHELVSKWRNRRPLLAADFASANFLRYLGLWVNVKSLNMYFDWEPINSESSGDQTSGDLNGYLYFMGFNLTKTETIGDEHNALKRVFSLRPNIHLEWAKLIYVFLASRGEKPCWLTDIDFAFFKQIFGDLEPLVSHGYNSLTWTHYGPGKICFCENKLSKICFNHDEHFFLLLLQDYYYVNKFGPVNIKVFKQLKKIKKEKKDTPVIKSDIDETLQDSKNLIHEKGFEMLKEVKKEKADVENNETERRLEEIEKSNCEETCVFKSSLTREKGSERLKEVKKEEGKECTMIKYEAKKRSTDTKVSNCEKTLILKDPGPRRRSRSPIDFDPTETPVKLGENKHHLMSKLFGRIKVEDLIKTEREDFKVSFDNTTGLSNVKSSMGSCISLTDISPPRVPLPVINSVCKRPRPRSISVVTSERRTRRKK